MVTQKQDLIVTKIVAGLFVDFCNPIMRGPKFKWSTFHEMAGGWVTSCFHLYFKDGYKFKEEVIREHAESYAKEMVQRAGFTDADCG